MTPRQPSIVPIRDAAPFAGLWPWSKGAAWRLQEPHAFEVVAEGFRHAYTIPAGYEFDGQSVPGLFHGFPLYYGPTGVGMRAGLEHDFLCDLYAGGSAWLRERSGGILPPAPPAPVIHEHYRLAQLADGQRPSKAKTTWLAVALFGPGGKLRPSSWFRRSSAALLACLFLGGCATTSLTVRTPEGREVRFRFPKNLAAEQLRVKVGEHEFEARNIRTDAATVIRAQGGVAAEVTAAAVTAASPFTP